LTPAETVRFSQVAGTTAAAVRDAVVGVLAVDVVGRAEVAAAVGPADALTVVAAAAAGLGDADADADAASVCDAAAAAVRPEPSQAVRPTQITAATVAATAPAAVRLPPRAILATLFT
jgi:hypothetical protein